MVIKLRKWNNYASGFGALLILIPFIISIILNLVFVPMGTETQNFGILYKPEGYEDMTPLEREAWLTWTFGGIPEYNYLWRLKLSWPDFAGAWYYCYPDGTNIPTQQWENFVNNEGDFIDSLDIVTNIIGINPPALTYLGLFGEIIRIILIVCVAIGLVEIIWIG